MNQPPDNFVAATTFESDDPFAYKRAADPDRRVKDRPRDPFQFAYNPDEWGIDYRGRLVPQISHIAMGVGNGAVDPQTGDTTQHRRELEARGWRFVPLDFLGDGSYVRRYRNTKGQAVHRSVFAVPTAGAPGLPTRWVPDQEAIDGFIELMRLRGLIEQPRPEVVAQLIEQQEHRLDNYLKKAPTDDSRRADLYKRRIEGCEAALATLRTELEKSEREHGRRAATGRDMVSRALKAARGEAVAAPEAPAASPLDRARARAAGQAVPIPEAAADPGDPDDGAPSLEPPPAKRTRTKGA